VSSRSGLSSTGDAGISFTNEQISIRGEDIIAFRVKMSKMDSGNAYTGLMAGVQVISVD
jgi:hypothetical protein